MKNLQIDAQSIRNQLEKEDNIEVKVALFGQPGAGKSTLINKLIGEKVAEEGVETDKTKGPAEYKHNGLIFVDLPGFGTKMFPKDSYFERIDISNYDLFLSVFSGKLHEADNDFFQELKNKNKVVIFVYNKLDQLWEDGEDTENLKRRVEADLRKLISDNTSKLVFTSCRTGEGIDDLEKEIANHLDKAKQERWIRSAKAYSKDLLDKKKELAEKRIALYSGLAAANAFNPVPGADVAVDIGIIQKMFSEIRNEFGINQHILEDLLKTEGTRQLMSKAKELISYSTKEGLLMLLKRYAGKETVEHVAKYIPLVGQAIAASIGFAITKSAGNYYLGEIYKISEEILNQKLEQGK